MGIAIWLLWDCNLVAMGLQRGCNLDSVGLLGDRDLVAIVGLQCGCYGIAAGFILD